jgi:hypothetical protein
MVVFLRVLLFADVLSNRKLLAMLLKNKGFEATACEDGMQAFNLITNMGDIDYYDVIFMDNTMPVMVSANFASPKYLCICSNFVYLPLLRLESSACKRSATMDTARSSSV